MSGTELKRKARTSEPAAGVPDAAPVSEPTRALAPPPPVAGRSGAAPVRRSLQVGAAWDPAEVEAEQTARRIADQLEETVPAGGAPASRAARRAPAPAAPSVGLAGGELAADSEQALSTELRSGDALPSQLRHAMEGAFQADLGHVRTHAGPRARALSDSMQAQAFTVDNHVFFRDGLPDGATRDGRELLAHELTHVLRHGGSTASRSIRRLEEDQRKRTPPPLPPKPVGLAPQRTPPPVPPKPGHKPPNKPLPPLPPKPVGLAPQRTPPPVPPKPGHQPPNKPLPPVPHHLKHSPAREHLQAGEEHAPNWESLEIDDTTESLSYGVTGFSDESGLQNDRSGLTNWAAGNNSDWSGADPRAQQFDTSDKLSSELTLSGGSELAMFSGLASLAQVIKDLKSGKGKENSAYDNISLALTGASGVATLGSGTSHLVGEAGKMQERSEGHTQLTEGGNLNAMDAPEAAGFDSVMGGLSGLKATLDVIKNLYDLITNWAEKDKAEVSRDLAETSGNLIKAAKAGVDMARTILGQWQQGNPALVGLAHAAPGLGLGIQIAEIIVRAYDMAVSWHNSAERRVDKRTAKQQLGGKVGVSSKEAAEKILDDQNADPAKREAAREYLLQKGLQNINDKRFRRALLKMGVAVTKAAGEGATVGGASAPVGFSLKLAAFAIDAGATIFRNVKQWGRNRAEQAFNKRQGQGEQTLWEKIFNKDKSTKKKIAEYNRMVDGLFDYVVRFDEETDPAKKTAIGTKVEAMVDSTGMSWRDFKKQCDKKPPDVKKLRAELVEAMRERG